MCDVLLFFNSEEVFRLIKHLSYKLLFLTLTLFPLIMYSQNVVIPLWDNENLETHNSYEKELTDGEYFYSIENPEIAVYLPSKRNSTGQAVLIIPGGGYHKISFSWEGTDVAKWLNANGIAGIVLKYRLPNSKENGLPNSNLPFLDAQKAMKIIRQNAEQWNINKEKIGVMGFSAGGHLASMLGTLGCENNYTNDSNKICPNFMILMYPVITMNKEFAEKGSKENLIGKNPTKDLIEQYSTEKHVSSRTPATFIVHASDDKVVPVKNSLLFYEALLQNGIKTEMHIYQYGGHGFSLANNKGYLSFWRKNCLNWLNNIK